MQLLIDKSIEQCEQMLLDIITLGMKRRRVSVANVSALRSVAAMGSSQTPMFFSDEIAYVSSTQLVYRWTQASVSADDGVTVIKPTDVSGTGRWLAASTNVEVDGINLAAMSTGVLDQVVLHNGDFSDDALKDRVFGRAPCVAIHFMGGSHKTLSQIPGALYDYRPQFEIWSVARNFRDRFEATLGSPVVNEGPSVMEIHGQVKKLLAGKMGVDELSISSVKWIEIGQERLEFSDARERIFVMALDVTLYASIHNVDAPAQLAPLTEIDVQRYQSQAPAGGLLDLTNAVTAGLTVPLTGSGFTVSVSAGSAAVNGSAVSVLATTHTFGASRLTYRDLTPLGSWVFTEVSQWTDQPPLTVGNLRVGLTTTDSAGIVGDTFLCSVYVPYPAANTPDVDLV